MADVTIFHNPACSKSRGTLAILEERSVEATVVRYLDTPPDRATLARILDAIGGDPAALVRTGDARFAEAGFTKADVTTRDGVLAVLLAEPRLMERPVVLVGDRGVIGRPPERVLDLLG
jgi:arsenate reductase